MYQDAGVLQEELGLREDTDSNRKGQNEDSDTEHQIGIGKSADHEVMWNWHEERNAWTFAQVSFTLLRCHHAYSTW